MAHILKLTGDNRATITCTCGKRWYYDQRSQAVSHAKEHNDSDYFWDNSPNADKLMAAMRRVR